MSSSRLENEHTPLGSTPHSLATLGVVIVAAGRGERLGMNTPKGFIRLHGRRLVEFSIAAVTTLPHAGHLVVVVPESHAAEALEIVEQVLPSSGSWEATVVPGGRERHESVRFGLAALPEGIDTVLVHDAARPFADVDLFEQVLSEVHRTGDAVVPALPVADTLKRVDTDGVVHETISRESLVAVQTPQGFPREGLEAAHATLQLQHGNDLPTDDAEVMQRAGHTVRTVPGQRHAHKLTTPEDLAILESILDASATEALEAP